MRRESARRAGHLEMLPARVIILKLNASEYLRGCPCHALHKLSGVLAAVV